MDLMRVITIAVVCSIAIILLRQLSSELAVVLTVISGVLLVFVVLDELFDVIYQFYELAESTSINNDSLSAVIKIIGIGYMSEFGNNICSDANCKSLGDKVVLAGKIAIMVVAMPIITNLIKLLLGLVT